MDKVSLINKIKAIGSCENDSDRLELLTQLQEECVLDYDKLTELEKKNTELSSDNESLRSANMKLFLRIGEKEPPKDNPLDDDKPKREFKNLFNEKGEIK